MGMFDYVILKFQCPYCYIVGDIEFQTKDFHNVLAVYHPGDHVDEQLAYIRAAGECHSKKCQEIADKRDIIGQGSPSGFGSLFYVKIRVDKGILTDVVFDVELDDDSTEAYVNKHKLCWKDIYLGRKHGKAIMYPQGDKNGRLLRL